MRVAFIQSNLGRVRRLFGLQNKTTYPGFTTSPKRFVNFYLLRFSIVWRESMPGLGLDGTRGGYGSSTDIQIER